MKLQIFRIENYKSIVDSGICYVSEFDNITVLAGQNESGKSSILQAIRDFHNDELSEEAVRLDGEICKITCCYAIERDDYAAIIDALRQKVELPQSIENYIKKIKIITLIREFDELKQPTLLLSEEETASINSAIKDEIILFEKRKQQLELSAKSDFSIGETAEERDAKLQKEVNYKDEQEELEEDEEDTEEVEEDEELDDSKNLTSKEKPGGIKEPVVIDIKSSDFLWEIITTIDDRKPKVIFFDDFCDLLPDKILIQDLGKQNSKSAGYQAVKNIEAILKYDLTKLDTLGDPQRNKIESQHHKTITANFNEKWTQRVGEGDRAKIYIEYNQGRAPNSASLKQRIRSTCRQDKEAKAFGGFYHSISI